MTDAREVNFDGLVGPTHNYGGLSHGNVASMKNRATISHPREAALQGLAKMRRLVELGAWQAVLPPHERPAVDALRQLGFTGSDADVIARAARYAPELIAAVSSASAMWTANAATVAPTADTPDERVHVSPANLVSKFHRCIEAPATTSILRAIFHDPVRFVVHDPLPAHDSFADEGAANHTRMCRAHDEAGLHLFVHGRQAWDEHAAHPQRFTARQTLEASQAIARRHGLADAVVIHARQSAAAIDAGAFHNDVVSVGNENVLLYHEQAFADSERVLGEIDRRLRARHGAELIAIGASAEDFSLEDAVTSYVFNSQVVSLPDGRMHVLAPVEARENPRVNAWLERAAQTDGARIARIEFLDLRQSMRNGGGPACLRLRVVLTAEERAALPMGVLLNLERIAQLEAWVRRHYRERLAPKDLADPSLLEESRRALDELTGMLGLGAIYEFQRVRRMD